MKWCGGWNDLGAVVCKCCCWSGSMTCRTGLGLYVDQMEVRCTPSRVPAVVVPKADENPPSGPTLNWPALSSRTQAKKVVQRSIFHRTNTQRSLSFFFFSCPIFFCFLCGQYRCRDFCQSQIARWAGQLLQQPRVGCLVLLLQAPFPPVGVEK